MIRKIIYSLSDRKVKQALLAGKAWGTAIPTFSLQKSKIDKIYRELYQGFKIE